MSGRQPGMASPDARQMGRRRAAMVTALRNACRVVCPLLVIAPTSMVSAQVINSDTRADFESEFEHLDGPVELDFETLDLSIPDDAVVLDSIDIPLEGEGVVRSLGTGVASYYGRRFHGRLTANGERFDMNAMTAAHRTLPFGSLVRVTYPATGRSVTVRINDRGPFIEGRSIDLSRGAAERIGMIRAGHARVELDLVGP